MPIRCDESGGQPARRKTTQQGSLANHPQSANESREDQRRLIRQRLLQMILDNESIRKQSGPLH